MSEVKFTPGEWRNGYRDDSMPSWDIYSDDFTRICTLPNSVSPQNEANARLLAASKDLYEACKAARIEMKWLYEQTNSRIGGSVDRAYRKLVAALLKVEASDE